MKALVEIDYEIDNFLARMNPIPHGQVIGTDQTTYTLDWYYQQKLWRPKLKRHFKPKPLSPAAYQDRLDELRAEARRADEVERKKRAIKRKRLKAQREAEYAAARAQDAAEHERRVREILEERERLKTQDLQRQVRQLQERIQRETERQQQTWRRIEEAQKPDYSLLARAQEIEQEYLRNHPPTPPGYVPDHPSYEPIDEQIVGRRDIQALWLATYDRKLHGYTTDTSLAQKPLTPHYKSHAPVYPKWKYHVSGAAIQVYSLQEARDLGLWWFNSARRAREARQRFRKRLK